MRCLGVVKNLVMVGAWARGVEVFGGGWPVRAPAKIGKAALLRLVALAHPPSEQGQRQPGLGAWRIFQISAKAKDKSRV